MRTRHVTPFLISFFVISLILSGCQKNYLDVLRDNVKKNPNSAKAHTDLAYQLAELKRYEEAIEEYDKAIGLRPGDYMATNNKAYIFFQMGRYQEALDVFMTLLPQKEDNTLIHGNIAMCLHNLKRYDEAYKEYTIAIELNAKNEKAGQGLKLLEEDMKKEGLGFPPQAAGAPQPQPPSDQPQKPQ